jgi:hypothetical protein
MSASRFMCTSRWGLVCGVLALAAPINGGRLRHEITRRRTELVLVWTFPPGRHRQKEEPLPNTSTRARRDHYAKSRLNRSLDVRAHAVTACRVRLAAAAHLQERARPSKAAWSCGRHCGFSAGRNEPFPCNTGEVPPADYIRPETSPNGDEFNVRYPLADAATATDQQPI